MHDGVAILDLGPVYEKFNQESAMKKAIAIAPRGKRAMELLNISVGLTLSTVFLGEIASHRWRRLMADNWQMGDHIRSQTFAF